MPDLFGVDIAGIIHDNISPGILAATLIKSEPGARTPGALTSGNNPVKTSYACRGVVLDYSERDYSGGNVQVGDRKILITANSIAGGQKPEPGDSVTIEGATYKIVPNGVKRDPAAASYECQCRR